MVVVVGGRTREEGSVSGEGRYATSLTRVPGANADDSSFLPSVGYFRPGTIFEEDSSHGFAAVLVRVCARWPAQHRPHRRRETRRQGSRLAGTKGTRVVANTFVVDRVPRVTGPSGKTGCEKFVSAKRNRDEPICSKIEPFDPNADVRSVLPSGG